MILNRDAGAERSSSHTGPRPTRRPTQPTVGGEGVVNMLRSKVSALAAVLPRRKMINTVALVVRDPSRGVAADTGPMRWAQRHVPTGGTR